MDNVNALNSAPSPFNPRPQLTKEQHRRFRTGAVVLAVIAFIIGVAYLWWMINKQEPVMQTQSVNQKAAETATILKNIQATRYEPTDTEVTQALKAIRSSKYRATPQDEATAIQTIKNLQ